MKEENIDKINKALEPEALKGTLVITQTYEIPLDRFETEDRIHGINEDVIYDLMFDENPVKETVTIKKEK